MHNKIFAFFCTLSLHLVAQDLRIVDFSNSPPTHDVQGEDAWFLGCQAFNFSPEKSPFFSQYENAWFLGCQAFNYSPELIPFFLLLQEEYNIPVAIETGTYEGSTTALLARVFDKVHTIEVDSSLFESAKKNLAVFANLDCHHGDSAILLTQLLSQHKTDKVLFYLDAHGNCPWPLLSELDAISKSHRDNCIVVIDDFKVPGRSDIAYDVYGNNECSYEYIQASLAKIFTEYECCCVIPKITNWRAKFVAFPKKWGIKKLEMEGYFH